MSEDKVLQAQALAQAIAEAPAAEVPGVRYRLATNDHSRGFLIDAGAVVGDGTPYPLIQSDPGAHMIPVTDAARKIWDQKAEKKGWNTGALR